MTTTPHLKSRAELTDTMSVCLAIQSPLLEYIMKIAKDNMAVLSCTNEKLIEVHKAMRDVAQLWVSGLVTDKEVADSFASVSHLFAHYERLGLTSGLLDPATGLKY
jgi:hypothetical protein